MASATRSAKGRRHGTVSAFDSDADSHLNDGLSDVDGQQDEMDAQESTGPHSTAADAVTASEDGECDPEETEDCRERKLMPPPSGTPRQLSRRRPGANRGSRRSLRARRRSESGSSQYYTSGAEEEETHPSRSKPSRNNSRSSSGQRGGGDQVRPPKIAYVSSATSLPPPQPLDPTIHFTEAVKLDERYGLASAKGLAQMALRDGREFHGLPAEPELIAYNLRMMGAAELIGHRNLNYEPPTDRWSASRASEQATQLYKQPEAMGDNSLHQGSAADAGPITEMERAEVIAQFLAEKAPELPSAARHQPALVLRNPGYPETDSQYAAQRERNQAEMVKENQLRAAVVAAAARAERQLADTQVGVNRNTAALYEKPIEARHADAHLASSWGPERLARESDADATQRQCDDITTALQQYQQEVQVVRRAAGNGTPMPLPTIGLNLRKRLSGDVARPQRQQEGGQDQRRQKIIDDYLRERVLPEKALTALPARPRYLDLSSAPPNPYQPELTTARSQANAALQRAQRAEELVEQLQAEKSARESAHFHSPYRTAEVPPLTLSGDAGGGGGGSGPPNPNHQKMRCKPPTFTGGNWAAFRQQFEKLARYYQWDEETKGLYLHTSIQGEAADALGVEDSASWSYDQLVEHLDKRHGRSKTYAQVLNEICSLFRRADMTNTQWHDAVIKVANTAHLSSEQYKHVAYHGFTFGLRMFPALQTWVLNRDDKRTLANATSLAEQYEHEYGMPVYVHLPLTVDSGTTFVHEKVATAPVDSKADNSDTTELAKLVRDMRAQMPKNNNQQAPKKDQPAQAPRESAAKQQPANNADKPPAAPGNGRGRNRGRRGRNARRQESGRGGNNQGPGLNTQAQQFMPYEQPWATQYAQPPPRNWEMSAPPPALMPTPTNYYQSGGQQVATPMLMPPPPAPPVQQAQRPPQNRQHRNSSAH